MKTLNTVSMNFGEIKYFLVVFSTSRKQVGECRAESYNVNVTVNWKRMEEQLK